MEIKPRLFYQVVKIQGRPRPLKAGNKLSPPFAAEPYRVTEKIGNIVTTGVLNNVKDDKEKVGRFSF